MCNSRVKFGVFLSHLGRHFPHVATGHYAQVRRDGSGLATLRCSPDTVKDQSYFLSNLRQDQLAKCLFPIGHLDKSAVRRLAESFALPTATRKDSQGICFLGKLKFDEFIGHYLGTSPGPVLDYKTRAVLGRHRGLWFHTIGQRKGLGPLLDAGCHDGPYFVAAKDVASNALFITNNLADIDKPRREFRVERVNWISGRPRGLDTEEGAALLVKMRHGPVVTPARVWPGTGEGVEEESLVVHLDHQDKGIAPGQFAAFYLDGQCLGAGVVSETALDHY